MSYHSKLVLKPWLLMAPAALMLASCSADEVEEVNRGNEITFSSHVSRATETTLDNLKEFKVYADGQGYTNSLFIDGETATKKDGTSNEYVLPKSYYWPNEMESIRFWAYGPTGENGIVITPNITADVQSFSSYAPEKNLVTGGSGHKDFVVAYTNQKRSEANGMAVPLKFHHALSQIVVNAKKGDDDTKRVIVKGAWIVNAKASGVLAFDETKTGANYMSWKSGTDLGNYGVVLPKATTLAHKNATLIGGQDNSSLMLIPQETGKFEKGDKQNGAYIMVLCRVEAIHAGTEHPGGGIVGVEDDNHVHQLFPVNKTTFNKDEYGYTCVPIEINWEPGKKYVYNLEFCGKESGAGIYPPEPGEGFPTENVVPRPDKDPDKKEVGDHVLDNPIRFTVEVENWTSDGEIEKPMQ